jgi:hypothetical protein
MHRVFTAALAGVVTLCFAAASFADPGVTNVSPSEGTVGTEITITGTELGTKPPLVKLKLHGSTTGKTIPLKLAKPFDGTTIKATVLKLQPGVYDMIVTPNRGTPITIENAFTGRAPLIDSLSSEKIAPGDVVDIFGTFFGTKRGRVTIGDAVARITSWTDQKITVVVSKRNKPVASATFDIFGKGGTQQDGASAEVVAALTGKIHFTVNFDQGGPSMTATDPKTTLAIDNAGLSFVLNAVKRFGAGINTNMHTLTITCTAPLQEGTVTAGNIIAIYTEAGLALRSYTSVDASGWTVVITRRAGNRVAGTITGGLVKEAGNGPATYNVTGDFLLEIQ